MGTIREKILEMSSLLSGTIREHFASMVPGSGTGGSGGDLALEVEMIGPEEVIVSEMESQTVIMEEADFTVKVVEKQTVITKE